MEKWEYATDVMFANLQYEGVKEYLQNKFHYTNIEKLGQNNPAALVPELDAWGREGWELVHIEPVRFGKSLEVVDPMSTLWHFPNAYFCAFKRRIPE